MTFLQLHEIKKVDIPEDLFKYFNDDPELEKRFNDHIIKNTDNKDSVDYNDFDDWIWEEISETIGWTSAMELVLQLYNCSEAYTLIDNDDDFTLYEVVPKPLGEQK